MTLPGRLLVLVLALPLAACSDRDGLEDDNTGSNPEADAAIGSPDAAIGSPDAAIGSPDAAAPVSFAGSVVPLLVARCGGCHLKDEGGSGGLSLGVEGQLAYAALVGQPTGHAACTHLARVDPASADPEESSLYLKLAGEACGTRMPKGSSAVPFTADELDLVASWIAAGAPDN